MTDKYIFEKTLYLPARNKVWGIVLSPRDLQKSAFNNSKGFYTHYWTWWAVVGKKLSMSHHLYSMSSISFLTQKKLSYDYKLINEAELLEMWPTVREEIHGKIIFEVLSKHE